jgi:hypothetical protein
MKRGGISNCIATGSKDAICFMGVDECNKAGPVTLQIRVCTYETIYWFNFYGWIFICLFPGK